MREGDVVVAEVPQADDQRKKRPALVLREMPFHRDLLICGISTRLHLRVPDFDEVTSPADSDFTASGLLSTSVVRPGFLIASALLRYGDAMAEAFTVIAPGNVRIRQRIEFPE